MLDWMGRIRKRLIRWFAGFGPLATASALFLAPNIAVFLLLQIRPGLIEWLWLAADRPWGIVTSAFTHLDVDHILSNIIGYAVSVVFLLISSQILTRRRRRDVSRRFLWLIFIAGIGANLIEYPLSLSSPSDHSWGASGVVYGSLGVALASAVLLLPAHLNNISRSRRRRARRPRGWRALRFDRRSMRAFPSLFALSMVISILATLLFDAGSFLNVAPGIDFFAHGVGFLLGFFGLMVWQRLVVRRGR